MPMPILASNLFIPLRLIGRLAAWLLLGIRDSDLVWLITYLIAGL